MIRHVWSVLCARTSIDQTTNNISLFEVLESIQMFVNMPVAIPGAAPFQATLVTLWARENLNTGTLGQARLRVIGPSGQPAADDFLSEIDLRTAPRTRAQIVFPGLPAAGNGVYGFQISWRLNDQEQWREVASVPLEVVLHVEPVAANPGAAQATNH